VKLFALVLASAFSLSAQGLNPAALFESPTTTWPTYNGDYSGRRYSTLKQIDKNQCRLAGNGMGLSNPFGRIKIDAS
jgi:hypothetical protein